MKFLVGRLLQAFVTMWIIATVAFFAGRATGNPVDLMLPLSATEEERNALIEQLGYVGFYLFTTVIAVPGIVVFWLLIRWDLVGADDNATAREASESRGAKISQS